ncbi:MAG: substrate-binding domain-containing protein [Opitutales bacterium]|nr:substrate-binding domain-containing protein [Opitutales bacterium]MCH8541288.1 substrate-binding domain-containing protein [Opitutales bacterium]
MISVYFDFMPEIPNPWPCVLVDSPHQAGITHLVLRGFLRALGKDWGGAIFSPMLGNFPADWQKDPAAYLRKMDCALIFQDVNDSALEAYVRHFDGTLFTVSDLPELKGKGWTISPDNYALGVFAAEAFGQSSQKHFAFCGYHSSVAWSVARGEGFAGVARKWKKPFLCHQDESRKQVRTTAKGNYIFPLGEQEMQLRQITQWLKTVPRETAIFAANDLRARQVLVAAQSLHRKVPDDLEILGADNLPVFCESMRPQISSVDPGWEEIGNEIARIVSSLSPSEKHAPEVRLRKAFTLVERGSAGVLTQRKKVVSEAMAYLRENLSHNPTRPAVAQEVGVSDRSLARYFEEVMGTSFREEKSRLQLQTARAQLSEGFSANEVTEATGFGEVSVFRRWFKTQTGKTVGQFLQGRGGGGIKN